MLQKIVITGGPGTGKSTILDGLSRREFVCMPEISRNITIEAQAQGVDQLFLRDPFLFSKLLLEGRQKQYFDADNFNTTTIFFDRGIPDIKAYLDYKSLDSPDYFWSSCINNRYTQVFMLPPWEEIYTSDNERYENFQQSVLIYSFLKKIYLDLEYNIIEVPKATLDQRIDFILNHANLP